MPDYLVGEIRVRPETGEVLRAGEVVHLEPKSMAVLVSLIDSAGEVIGRETLLDEVWPDMLVGDDSLTATIIKIRRALGDDARNPSYVETIPKRGYRLIAPVRPADPGATAPRRGAGVSVRRRAALVGAVGVLLTIGLVAIFWPRQAAEPEATAVTFAGDKPAIAVTPFENASRDPAQDYLAAGIGETIVADLAQMQAFTVRRLDGAQTATAADTYRLDGSVLREGDVIRIEARLVDAATGEVLSAQRFDRPFADLLTIEDEIRDTVLVKLEGSIAAAEQSRRARGYTDNVAAYDLFLKGQRDLLIRTSETNLSARRYFRRAIDSDPDFARAYGGLALTYAAEFRNGWVDDPKAALDQAMKYARTAIGIAPDLPEQLWVVGYVLTQKRRYGEAVAELKTAIGLDPDYADAYALLGGIETYRENPAATVPLLREAMRRNADSGALYFLLLARAYYFLGDFEQAEINLNEALARNPENLETHLYLAATLHNLGRTENAAWQAMEVTSTESGFRLDNWSASYPMARGAQLDHLLADLHEVGLP